MSAADWIANARSLTQSSSIPLGVPVAVHMDMLLRDTRRDLRTAADALEKVLEAIEGTDRDWTPYFDDNSAYAAGYRFAVEQVLNGVHRVITEALGVEP